jgi:hypothetical protein
MNYTLNFGAIKDSVFKFSGYKMLKEGKENDILKRFLSEVKSKPLLKAQYFFFKNLEEGYFDKENLAERYLNQNLNLVKNFNWHEILQEHKVLRKLYFPEEFVVLGSVEKRDLYESIATLIESVTKPGYSNFNKSEQAYDFVLNHLTTKKVVSESVESKEKEDMPSVFSWKYVTQKAVNNFNERYSHLDESEKSLLKILMQDEKEKKLYLEHLIKETLTLIESNKKEENNILNEALNKFETKIKSIKEKESKNIDEDIMNIQELKENLKK